MSLSGVPARGVPLGWRLGLTTSVIVTLVLGVLTGVVQKREIERGREDRRLLLEQTLAPLAADVEEAPDLPTIQARLSHFQVAHFTRGHGSVRVLLLDAKANVVASPLMGPAERPPRDALTARVPVRSRLLPGQRGDLEIWQDETRFREMAARRWRQWILSLGVAALCILVSLYLAYVLLIERPMGRLLEGVKQMEQGYWSGLEIPRGAWEMRWLAYRFRNLGTQLEETVRRLVEAERRTYRRASNDTAGPCRGAQGGGSSRPGGLPAGGGVP